MQDSIQDKVRYSPAQLADVLSVSKYLISKWEKEKILTPYIDIITGEKYYGKKHVVFFSKHISSPTQVEDLFNNKWFEEIKIKPNRNYTSLELFAGAGGLAIGLEKAGFNTKMLNDIDKNACATLKYNRPNWNVIEGDISNIDFLKYRNQIDLLSGGFPCQAFSYAGKKLGFQDVRGTLFFQFTRALKECNPKVFVAENVKGLLFHDKGKTFEVIKNTIADLGYVLVEPKILRAIFYQVPQKRERLIIVGVRSDMKSQISHFAWPAPYYRIMTLKDALKAGELYDTDVPISDGQSYTEQKTEILSKVPQGGYWRDLPDELQRKYMQNSYFLGGGKTGIARRLSWEEPSLTLTCAPAQKQTERCHPEEHRPLTIREYARIQTFMDDWEFCGSLSNQYKQIGNAVPVNLAYAIGRSLVNFFNKIESN